MLNNSQKDIVQEKALLEQELSKVQAEKIALLKRLTLVEKNTEKFKTLYTDNLNSTSYKLGHLLLHETRSLRSLIALPKRIFNIWNKTEDNTNRIDLTSLNEQASNPNPLLIKTLKELKIACILDTFSFDVFGPEAKFLQITPEAWKEEMEAFQPNMLLIESAWRGKDDLWRDKVHIISQELIDIIVYSRQNGIATVFWNKEDPFHFDDLIETAQYFDFVFTTDIKCIPIYKSRLKHDNVFLLPFACQPKIHNPIEKFERKDAFVFAGAYYPHFPERMKVFEDFINHLVLIGDLDIYDRHFGNTNTSNVFPKEYHPLIRGTLAYHEIDKAYKGYKYAINLNSITSSPTMFSRRVFELMASNTLVLSNYAEGIPYLFGDLLIATDSGEELTQKLHDIIKNPLHEKKIRLLALRKVMLEHTAENRLDFVASIVYQHKIEISLPQITLVSYAKNETALDKILQTFKRQNYKNKYLVVVHPESVTINTMELENVQSISKQENKDFSEIGNPLDYIAGISPDDYYGENYLLDLALATHYTDASIVGKGTYYNLTSDKGLALENTGSEYHIINSISARSSIIKTETILSQNISEWSQALLSHVYNNDNILSIDEFNYARNTQQNIFSDSDIETISDLRSINTGVEIASILQDTAGSEGSVLASVKGEVIHESK